MFNFWQTILAAVLSGGIVAVVIGALLNHFSVKKIESESLQKVQAAKIAEFFAKWAKYNAKEKEVLDKTQLYDYYEELTKMSYELSLWVKDEKLLKKIMSRLINKDTALQVKQLLIEVRELILDKAPKELTADDLVHWSVNENPTHMSQNSEKKNPS